MKKYLLKKEGFKIFPYIRYLWGFIGAEGEATIYIREKVANWVIWVELFSWIDKKDQKK